MVPSPIDMTGAHADHMDIDMIFIREMTRKIGQSTMRYAFTYGIQNFPHNM